MPRSKMTPSLIKCAGCASKLAAAQLAQVLSKLPKIEDKSLLVGLSTVDDAGVYKVNENLALVYTVDVMAPVVEDPFTFGLIAAANCISDVYAMGGDPKIAVNVIGFPTVSDLKDLSEILRGGMQKAREADVIIVGGHTFKNEDIKYGMSVVGYINPQHIITNAAAKPGDLILLTKPIGIGTLLHACFTNRLHFQDIGPAISAMTTLNRDASVAARKAGVLAGTDITGYGLAGHLTELAQASNVGIELDLSKIPLFDHVLDLYQKGVIEPGITMNMQSFGAHVYDKSGSKGQIPIIFGSETSGGLAISMPEKKVSLFIESYKKAVIIGRVISGNAGKLIVKC